jgi:hypothetical protein
MSIFNSTLVDSVASSVYTSTGNSAVTTAYFCNKTPSAVIVNVFVVASGAVASGDNIIYSNLNIAGYDTYVMETERLLFNNGDFISANSSVPSAVVSTVSFTGI